MKKKIYLLLYENEHVIKFIYGLIIVNVIALILESYKEMSVQYKYLFESIELFSVMVFSIEYLARLWVADLHKKGSKIKFLFSPMGLIDLIAILPFYLPMIFVFDLRILRILRLFRLIRIFKLGRFSRALKTISEVLKETKADLAITLFVAFVLLVLSSTLMYYIEGDVQPDKFGNVGESLWWAIATLTTVGYGDVYPVTGLGKLLSGVIALIGIGFVALPTGIISSAFLQRMQKIKEHEECECPECGAKFKM